MSEDAKEFDRELGELLQLHRTARGLSTEDVAKELGLLSMQVERYETGSNRLSVFRYCAIMSILREDPAGVLDQLRERMSIADGQTGHVDRSGIEFMASNRGRKVINALAMCDEPEVLDALADLILAIAVHTRAKVRFSDLSGSTPKIRS
ncbi:MAG: helix-turn-helix transcriptional regulator [Paracoccaceae bacterium]|nr:helix-turn-helix transcriptional regulator [Paracoccaceae bacterium]